MRGRSVIDTSPGRGSRRRPRARRRRTTPRSRRALVRGRARVGGRGRARVERNTGQDAQIELARDLVDRGLVEERTLDAAVGAHRARQVLHEPQHRDARFVRAPHRPLDREQRHLGGDRHGERRVQPGEQVRQRGQAIGPGREVDDQQVERAPTPSRRGGRRARPPRARCAARSPHPPRRPMRAAASPAGRSPCSARRGPSGPGIGIRPRGRRPAAAGRAGRASSRRSDC
jgi:hypothetical protein